MSVSGGFSALENLNKTTSGALFAAILTLLFLTSKYLPVLGTVAVFFCPLPIILMHVRFRDTKYTALVVMVATTLIAIFSGPISGFFFALLIGLMGFTLGVTIASQKSALYSITAAATVMLMASLFATFAAYPLMGIDVSMKRQSEIMSETMKKVKEDNLHSLRKSGASSEQVAQIEKFYDQTIEAVRGMYVFTPVMLFISALISAFINYRVACMVLKKLHIDAPGVPPFETWRMPWTVVWGFIAALLALNALDEKASEAMRYGVLGARNIVLAFQIAFIVTGLSVVHFYLKRFVTQGAIRFFVYALIVVNPVFQALVMMAGLCDPWLDLRKLENPETNDNDNDKEKKEV